MKVDCNSKIKFGMALHMNTKAIGHKMGNILANAVEQKRPNLEELAKDCYVEICPRKLAIGSGINYFDITVGKSKWNILHKKLQAIVLKQECVYNDVYTTNPLIETVKNLVSCL